MSGVQASNALETVIELYERTLKEERRLRVIAEAALSLEKERALSQEGYRLFVVGVVESPLRGKRGAPRQGALAPSLPCRVRLTKDCDASSLEGLQQYSHAWILYLFHADEPRKAAGPAASSPPWVQAGRCAASKISPPGMAGGRAGVLSTRSPHRPNALALTLCRVEGVEGRCLVLSGCDAIDASPVFDIKPYLPGADAPYPGVPVRAPAWVAGPLAAPPPLSVTFEPRARRALEEALEQGALDFFTPTPEGRELLLASLSQVLSLDIRSVHQGRGGGEQGVHCTDLAAAIAAARAAAAAAAGGGGASQGEQTGLALPLPAGEAPLWEMGFDNLVLKLRYAESTCFVVEAEREKK